MDKKSLTVTYTSFSVEDTIRIGKAFAATVEVGGLVIVLRGELGAGKTQFTKGIASAFSIAEEEIASPTFALANEYDARMPDGSPITIYHLDCYRFERPEELLELGVEEYLYPKTGMTIIEWPERIEQYLPVGGIEVLLETISENERRITITSYSKTTA